MVNDASIYIAIYVCINMMNVAFVDGQNQILKNFFLYRCHIAVHQKHGSNIIFIFVKGINV
jgi:hypothetical protein